MQLYASYVCIWLVAVHALYPLCFIGISAVCLMLYFPYSARGHALTYTYILSGKWYAVVIQFAIVHIGFWCHYPCESVTYIIIF